MISNNLDKVRTKLLREIGRGVETRRTSSGFRVQGLGLRVEGLGLRVEGFKQKGPVPN